MAIEEEMIWHQIHLDRFKQGVQNDMLKMLERSRKLVQSKFKKLSSDIEAGKSKALWTQKRMEHQINEINGILENEYRKMNRSLAVSNKSLVTEEIDWNKELLQKEFGATLSIAAPTTTMVMASVKEEPFAGWAGKRGGAIRYSHSSPLRKVPATHIRQMERIVREAYLTGAPTTETAKQIDAVNRAIAKTNKSYNLARRNTTAEVRTSIQTYSQRSRDETIEANSDIFPWVQFVATLDGRTTTICGSLDGRTYRQNDPSKPAIPQHWNCRSTYVPKTSREEVIEGERPSIKPGKAYEQGDNKTKSGKVRKPRLKFEDKLTRGTEVGNKTFQQWLQEQDKRNPEFTKDYFKTEKRYEAWKEGKMGNIRYTATDGRAHDVKALRNVSLAISESSQVRIS